MFNPAATGRCLAPEPKARKMPGNGHGEEACKKQPAAQVFSGKMLEPTWSEYLSGCTGTEKNQKPKTQHVLPLSQSDTRAHNDGMYPL